MIVRSAKFETSNMRFGGNVSYLFIYSFTYSFTYLFMYYFVYCQ